MGSLRRRRAVLLSLCAVAGAAAALCWPLLYAGFLAPLSLLTWLLLRLFVLSVDQRLYWLALTCAVPALLFHALRRPPGPSKEVGKLAPVHPLESWRRQLELESRRARERRLVGWDGLVHLLVSMKALERRVPADYLVHDDLRLGRLSLPPAVQAYAFPAAPAPPAGWPARLFLCLREAPRRALRRLDGRDVQERRQAIAAVLAYLEDSLELTPHDDPSRPPRP